MIICIRTLNCGRSLTLRDDQEFRDALVGERMRLARRAFDRGMGRDFRPQRLGGRRTLLPLV